MWEVLFSFEPCITISVFKTGWHICLFQLVHSKYTGKNTVAKPNTPPSDNFLKTKAFWELVVEDLLELQKIMDPAPPAKEEQEPERWRW